ncbi:MAG: pyruvate kinase [Tissierellia bacterium]|nr:pyruvate kinase [Tissierellia bacterium]
MLKKTKIVCTIGPASESEEMLEKLMKAGMNVCRLNFSHGTHEEHQMRIDAIKKVREKLKTPVAIMLDTKGPEIRLGDFKEGVVNVKMGSEFTFTTRDILGDETIASITYKELPEDVEVGDKILVDDGLVEFKIKEIKDGTDLVCEALNNGEMKNHKGVNVPGVKIQLPAVTEKDKDDILFGIKNEVDYIAASFVRKVEDVNEIRRILEENHGEFIDIISKIENQEGIDNMDKIIEVSDGIMVARGDMGVEVAPEEIPLVQKELIKKCSSANKPVITATQMLDSMIRNPRPTRAEVTDVANAILDGTSAIMLSGETAAGKYPESAVKMMTNIALRIEKSLDYKRIFAKKSAEAEISTTNAIAKSTCSVASDLQAAAIITASESGITPRAICKFRPETPIICVSPDERTIRRLALSWGVYPVMSETFTDTDELFDGAVMEAKAQGYVEDGDLVVITAGVPLGLAGSTNMLKVQTLGKVLVKGSGIGKASGIGRVVVGNSEAELLSKFEHGDILVCKSSDREMVKLMEHAKAIVIEEGGLTSHGAIVGLNLGIPTIVGAKDATEVLKDGDIVTVDANSGYVYMGKAVVK